MDRIAAARSGDGARAEAARAGVIGVVLATAVPLVGCERQRQEDYGAATASVAAEVLVSADWLRESAGISDMVTLHVGADRDEFIRSHIAGARFLPLSAVVVSNGDLLNELPPLDVMRAEFAARGVGDSTRVIIYGHPLHAARAFVALDVLGHRRMSLLDGSGHALASRTGEAAATVPVMPAAITTRPRPDRIVDAEWLLEHLVQPELLVIDARDPSAYAAGHLPGAVSLPWQQMLAADGTLRSDAELRALFTQAGAAPARVLVAYCRSGMQASMTYFIARYLGYDVRLYDGSYVDWTARALPVAG